MSIFQPILMILVSKFMVRRALSDTTYLLLGLLSPLSSLVVSATVHSGAVVLLLLRKFCVLTSSVIKTNLVALLVHVLCLFLTMPWVDM